MMSNLKALPLGGRVPMHDRLRRIRGVRQHGRSWRYHLDDGTSVSHEVILQSIAKNALFQLKQEVMMGKNGWRMVVHRKWSFKYGITFYRVADPRRNVASGWIPEDRMVAFTQTFQTDPAPGTPPGDELPPDLDLQFVM